MDNNTIKNNSLSGKRVVWPIIIFILVVVLVATLIQFVSLGVDALRLKYGLFPQSISQTTSTIPMAVIPSSTINQANPPIPLSSIALSPASYTPSSDVLTNHDAYKKQAIRLVIGGKFQTAQVHIIGSVNEDGDHFIFFSYGEVGGVLNAARLSPNRLDVNLTNNLGGVYTKDKPIDLLVDLLGKTTIAQSAGSFVSNGLPTQAVSFWNSNLLPPTWIQLLVAPFNQNGVVGGATISKIDFQYACADGSDCKVAVCPLGKLATACLKENFGADAARSWCIRAKLDGCESL